MHECPECGQACDCDGEDVWNDIGSSDWLNCSHECELDIDDEEDFDDGGYEAWKESQLESTPSNTACSGQGLCPECDSAILPSQYCMMGHWCGERPAANANRSAASLPAERKVKIMSLKEWSDLHGEDYPKRKFFSALDYGRGDRTCMTIYCDYCEQPFEIKEDELDDWIVIDPVSGDKVVMCGECESKSTKKKYSHYETCPANNGGTCSCGY